MDKINSQEKISLVMDFFSDLNNWKPDYSKAGKELNIPITTIFYIMRKNKWRINTKLIDYNKNLEIKGD